MVATYREAARPTPNTIATFEGGVVYEAGRWCQLRRFLILGTESGSYYDSAENMTVENIGVVRDCLAEAPAKVIEEIVEVSESGLAPKNDPALLALAMASAHYDLAVRKYAFEVLPRVARTGTHLLHFASFREAIGAGWGRAYKTAIRKWFTEKEPMDLAYQVVKYPSRDQWALADILKLSHAALRYPDRVVIPPSRMGEMSWDTAQVVRRVVGGSGHYGHVGCDITSQVDVVAFLMVCDRLLREEEATPEVLDLIVKYRVPREALNTKLLSNASVWEALLESMPITATIRNLGKMSSVGLLKGGSKAERKVVAMLEDENRIRNGRVHPMAILIAARTYDRGEGERGSLTWKPTKAVSRALDDAFYLAFKAIEPSGKRIRLALDVSSSMMQGIAGSPLTAREAEAAMALVTIATEPNVDVVAFSHKIVPFDLRETMRLPEVMIAINRLPFGGTDCSVPIRQALSGKVRGIDAFVTYTDNETGGLTNVERYLRDYRVMAGHDTKHALVAFTATNKTLINRFDPYQMDFVGLDAAMPAVLSAFIAGRV